MDWKGCSSFNIEKYEIEQIDFVLDIVFLTNSRVLDTAIGKLHIRGAHYVTDFDG